MCRNLLLFAIECLDCPCLEVGPHNFVLFENLATKFVRAKTLGEVAALNGILYVIFVKDGELVKF